MFETLARAKSWPLLSRANMLLPGLYAWVATVAYPASQRGVPGGARFAALLALLALVAAPVLAPERALLSRLLGLYSFTACSVLAWALAGSAISPERLDPVRGAVGAIAWMLHALGWGAMRPRGAVPEDDPNVISGTPLLPRNQPARG